VKNVRFCILGAGPSGLAFAAALEQAGCDSFVLLEKEAEAGGLCRSAIVDGAPLDIGGGHFLDVRRQRVLDFLFRYMPREEWREFERTAKIRIRGAEVEHPLEGNLWQLPSVDQIDFLESIAHAGSVHGTPEPGMFEDWIRWKLGERIAEEYMLPYNRKIWSMPLSALATDWMHKLPSVSFRETLQSCLERKPGGNVPAHGRFLYPCAHGYGEVWKRISASLGDRFMPGYDLRSIDFENRIVDGSIQADMIVNTIPWDVWTRLARLPEPVQSAVHKLVYTGVHVDYHSENLASPAHWIYEPDETVPHHRQLLRHNFVAGARGHWTETNVLRSPTYQGFRFTNEHAYPVGALGKPEAIATVLAWARGHGIIGLGRWGTWEHLNSDVAVDLALTCAEGILAS
jgi:protoporphyrinogen oxidase